MKNNQERYETAFRDMAANLGLEVNWYSGRGMYGERCLSVNTNEFVDQGEIRMEWKAQVKDEDLEPIDLSWDSMGLGSVLYLKCFTEGTK